MGPPLYPKTVSAPSSAKTWMTMSAPVIRAPVSGCRAARLASDKVDMALSLLIPPPGRNPKRFLVTSGAGSGQKCPSSRLLDRAALRSAPVHCSITRLLSDENEDERWMAEALAEARRAESAGEVPVGAIVARAGLELPRAHNAPISLCDPTAHAELLALRRASERSGEYRIPGATL